MAGYLGAIPVPQATQHRETFTATSGQTTFNTAGYTVGFLDVYLNGSHLSPADFTATNGSDVVLASGASADDVCDIISYTAFEVADQTFTGTTTLDGAVVINESSADVDFRVESNGNANMLFVDGGNNAVGIGTGSPTVLLDLEGISPVIRLTDSDATGTPESQISGAGGDLIFDADRDNEKSSTLIIFNVDGSERMRIDSSGNVGIGVTPSYKLDVASTVQIRAGESLRLQNAAGSSAATIQCAGAGGNSDLGFSTAGTERMRIDSSGNVLVGVTGTGDLGTTNQGVLLRDGFIQVAQTGTTSTKVVYFYNGNGEVGSISTSGSATAFNTSSDYRLKTDAQPMTGATARLKALNPVNFQWIADGTRVDGFLAHEAQAVVPECVTGTKDAMMDEEYEVTPAVLDADGNETKPAVMGTRSVPDMQGIDQSKLVPLLVASLQEALARITALENA